MRLPFWLILSLCAGCAVRTAPTLSASEGLARVEPPAEAPPAVPAEAPPAAPPKAAAQEVLASRAAAAVLAVGADASAEAAEDSEDAADPDDNPSGAPEADETESAEASPSGAEPSGPLYSAELSDEDLSRLWKENVASLGSVSVGFAHSGRMVNSVRVPNGGEDWIVVSPDKAWATQETVDYLTRAIREVRARFPQAPPLRVNQLSSKEGGYMRPHKSHQSGRDVDLGFYYPTAEPIRARERERYIHPGLNWALVRALVIHTDVQMILVDRRVQQVLYDYALSIGEDKAWLDSLFNAGAASIVKHARRHRDHFHVRFYNPRAQELGRRLAPLLALQPDKNVTVHRVRSGDTLGGIALRYGASLATLRKANRLRGTLLRIGQVLSVPLRGPCTRCPVPPPLVVPPRRLPPEPQVEPAAEPGVAPAEEPKVEPAVAQAPGVATGL